jgi:hypothetical protein
MQFRKSKMQEELYRFMTKFGEQIAKLYDGDDFWANEQFVGNSPIMIAVSEMYDYGVLGIPTGDLLPGSRLDGIHAQIEMFFRGIDTPQMRVYLDMNYTAPPPLAMLTVQIAVARMVLDGGHRYNAEAVEYEIENDDDAYLTLAEVALLAKIDERSVRNAANPKLSDPLKTEQIGKRSLVSREEARRWLTGRKGYIPTKECEGNVAQHQPEFNKKLNEKMVAIIEQESQKAGISFEEYLEKIIVSTDEGTDK